MVEEEQCYVESVGGIDENIPSTSPIHMLSVSVHMHLHLSQMLKVCICKLPTCQMMMFHSLLLQKHKLWFGNLTTAYQYAGGFFIVNGGLPMDLVKPEVLQCKMCRSEQASNDVLAQRSTLCKGLIKFNKVNDITPNCTFKLFAQKKQLNEKGVEPIAHVWQFRKKRTSSSGYAITAFFATTNSKKN